jgi:hypothetical protein
LIFLDSGLRRNDEENNAFPIFVSPAKAYALYEKFRPDIPPGKKGWRASGKLDLDLIRKMASA